MNKNNWILLTLLGGAVLPIQAGLNAKLGKAAESPMHATTISFIVGLIGLILYIIITKQTFSLAGIKGAPAYAWLGGLFGAFYVTVVILSFKELGPALTFGLIVSGQMICSVLLEHFKILVAQPNPISMYRLIGVAFVVVGVIIIRKF
jgi:bacterial/archaeal transporter family-2 protein